MKIKKITTGYVVQIIDSETGELESQEFVAGDQTDFEDEDGDTIDNPVNDSYFPYDMVQPVENISKLKFSGKYKGKEVDFTFDDIFGDDDGMPCVEINKKSIPVSSIDNCHLVN